MSDSVKNIIVDLVVVDAVQDICKISLGIEIIELGRFDDRHGSRDGSRACKKPTFPTYHCQTGDCAAICREGPFGRSACSAGLLSRATRPSLRNRLKVSCRRRL